MTAEELAELQRRADAGEPGAQTALGKLLVSGGPQHMLAGARYIDQAAAKGDAEALEQLAALTASGIGRAPSWERALDHLQHSAELGWRSAQEQLRLLARRDGDDFADLRHSIDVAAWLAPPETTVAFEQPRIVTVRGLMTAAECARTIEKARPKLARAGVYDHASGREIADEVRSNSRAELWRSDVDLPVLLLHARMAALLGRPRECFELTNVLRYLPGQEFKTHVDFLHANEPGMAASIEEFGQRIATLLVYLNEDYAGGETHFPRLDFSFKGRTGDALMFANVNDKGEPEPLSLHAGLPPASGEKWLLSQWVRSRPLFRL